MVTHFNVSLYFQGRKPFSGPPRGVQSGNKPFATCGFFDTLLKSVYVQIKDQYCQYTEHMLIKNI